MVHETRDNRDQDTKKWDQDQSESNIVDLNGISDPLRRVITMLYRPVFHV